MYLNDEESMIPKGLLDQPYDKPEDHYFNEVTASNPNSNMLSYGIPCYIAVFPQPTERQINYSQFSGGSSYFPPETPYVYPPGNEYVIPNQRDVRTLNNPQCNRSYQGVDYSWWNHGRQNHLPYIPNTNVDMRHPNMQRNIGMAERFYEQQNIHEHPYDYQRDMGYKAHFSYENNYINTACPQVPFPKNFCRNQNKYRREFQQTQEVPIYLKNMFFHDMHTTTNVSHGNNSPSFTISKPEEANRNTTDHEQLMTYLTINNMKYKSNDLNTFKKIALDGCLQLEKLLATNNDKISAKNLEELCRSVKSQLSHSINTFQTELILRELILGFLHICNSWICISSIITMNKSQNIIPFESNLQTLLVDFENWQNTSKTLLEKLLIAVQEISLDHEQYIKDVYRGTVTSKGIKEPEKNHNDIDDYKTDIINRDFKQKRQNIATVPTFSNNNESFNLKQVQSSPADNSILFKYSEKDDISCTSNSFVLSEEYSNNYQNINCQLNQNKNHDSFAMKQKPFCHSQGIFSCISSDNMTTENNTVENNIEYEVNKITQTEKKVTTYPLFQKNICSSKLDASGCSINKHFTIALEKGFSFETENISALQHEVPSSLNSINENNNLKNDNIIKNKLTIQDENKYDEEEEHEYKNKSNNEVNQNCQVTHDRYNPKYNRKKSLKNRICNFSKNYSKPAENNIYAEQIINIKTYSKSKLQDVFSAIQGADLEKFVTQRISDNDITKIRQSITYPLFSISYSVNKDCYQNLNDVLDDLYKLFFKAKCENKGNITLLTVANRLELKLINMMFEEIGIC
ncbi:putative uncharacterized protein DDB_G0267840 [Halyomorpha halys]|uniref:putative uncharacterized protein DDB_G0267840 n=1 Tax=Halyomorpha halys TaxID=286706 RepID=UPI000D0C9208|nr:uncharacterized protein LOC106685065 isoform X2 [Halyomorpha halys]